MRGMIALVLVAGSTLLLACASPNGPLDLPAKADRAAAKANELGAAHYKLGDADEGHWIIARGYFEEAIKIEPRLPEPHYNLALTLDKLGAHPDATAEFKKAAELAPDNTAITRSQAYRNHLEPGPNRESGSRGTGGY